MNCYQYERQDSLMRFVCETMRDCRRHDLLVSHRAIVIVPVLLLICL